MQDKRDSFRLTIDIPIKIRQNGSTANGQTRNLSCGGIFIQAPLQLKDNKPCDVVLHLPDGRPPMVIKTQVMWKEPDLEAAEAAEEQDSGAGLQFQNLAPEEKARIQEFIRRNTREDLH